jgi:hypothetical protein
MAKGFILPLIHRDGEAMNARTLVESWAVDILPGQHLLLLTINDAVVELPISVAEMIGRALQARAREAGMPSGGTAANDQRKD